MTHPNDDVQLKLAVIAQGDRGKAKNAVFTWGKLRRRLLEKAVDTRQTIDQYLKFSTDKKNKVKDFGSFVLGHFEGNIRKRENIHFRSGISLDIDAPTEDQMEFLKEGWSTVCAYEFFAHTTRSHTPEDQRWRAFFPLSRPVTVDEFGPLSRILASKLFRNLEESMDAVDDVSFRVAQIMYWPSISMGGTFETFENRGKLLDPDEVLNAFVGDWHDWTQLPFSEKRGQKRPAGLKKAEVPTEKRGLVGAFCRVYDVPDAIDRFIPEVYKLTDKRSKKPRYTYMQGSSANGAVIEDGGLFLYSHHSSDPCGERLVNAFDMVRLHLYGELDADEKDDTLPTQLPSWEAMEILCQSDSKIAAQLIEENYDPAAMFDDLGDEEDEKSEADDSGFDTVDGEDDDDDDLLGLPKKKKKHEWLTELEVDQNGFIKPTLTNLTMIVQNDPRLTGQVEYNEFINETVTRKDFKPKHETMIHIPVKDKKLGDLWQEHHDNNIRVLIEAPRGKGKNGYGMKVTDRDLADAVDLAARKCAFHPIRHMFENLKWDGKKRLDTLFVDYLGCKDNAYTRAVSKLTILGAVARTFEPGHKFDHMTIVEGLQGLGKSTFFNVLGMGWFAEMEGDFEDRKKAVETMQGALIVEVAELSQFNRTEVQQIKQFVSATEDKTRLSYAKRAVVYPRQCILVGTTNEGAYLRDTTGNRRFWPIKAETAMINIVKLKREVEQIWAEAVAVYREMRVAQPHGTLPLYLSGEAERAEAVRVQESRRIETSEDSYVGLIERWLNTPVTKESLLNGSDKTADAFDDLDSDDLLGEDDKVLRDSVCLMEIHVEMLNGSRESYGRSNQLQLARAMARVEGWEEGTLAYHRDYGRQKVFRRKKPD